MHQVLESDRKIRAVSVLKFSKFLFYDNITFKEDTMSTLVSKEQYNTTNFIV